MLAGHALAGCAAVGSYFGIGKRTILKVLKQKGRLPLNLIVDVQADCHDVRSQATSFRATCWGSNVKGHITLRG